MAGNADVEQGTRTLSSSAETLQIGQVDAQGNIVVSGNGTLLRVSSDPSASIVRSGVTASTTPNMTISQGAKTGNTAAGGSVTLDSTNKTSLDPTATLSGSTINLDSGQISLQLANPGSLQPTAGLVLSSDALQTLENSATSLSLLSYSSIDFYGSGPVGKLDGAGQPTFTSLALHAGEIRGFNTGGVGTTFNAQKILLDNSANGTVPGQVAPSSGSLTFNAGAGTIDLGANQLAIDQYNRVALNAGGGILLQGPGGLTTQGALTMTTPLLTGATGANQVVTAGGNLELDAGGNATVTGGLGASLKLVGTIGLTDNSNITLPSGTLTMHAVGGDVSVGAGSLLDVSGTAQSIFDATQYTSGGQITLAADAGNVTLAAGSKVNVSAQPAAGNAGSLTISAPTGAFTASGVLLGQGSANGQSGTFSLDVASIPAIPGFSAGTIDSLSSTLLTAGFTQSISIRDRGDASVTLDGPSTTQPLTAQSVNLSADTGSINVAGKIDASGVTGGAINLDAYGNVTLLPGSLLTVEGSYYNDAGKGGAVSLLMCRFLRGGQTWVSAFHQCDR